MSPKLGRPPITRSILRLALIGGFLVAVGCGKKGPPLAPLQRGPDRITGVSARQEGNEVVLVGLLPEHSQDGGPLTPITEVLVFRLDRGGLVGGTGASSKSFQRSAMRQFTKDSRRVASLMGEALAAARTGRRLTFVDQKPLEGPIPQAGKDLTYALTAVDAEKRSSLLSPFAAIRILPPPQPPVNLKAELSEKNIRLSWEAPPPLAEGDAPLYNVYRSEVEGVFLDPPRNALPLTTLLFEETSFTFGKHYSYVVRSVLVSGKSSRESVNSAALGVDPRDVYAPAAPSGFAVSAEAGVLKLFWFPNDETDLAAYKVYRSESETGEFVEIGRVAPTESSYVDQAVKPGVRYYYCLTAVDGAEPPNESSRSEVRGDRLPPATPPAPVKKKPGKS
ncbi:MAG: hypothetical protein L0Z52_11590 [Acidobacteria bacterium]|nr:hypothetical protein [Acidobacteriota bacterium]